MDIEKLLEWAKYARELEERGVSLDQVREIIDGQGTTQIPEPGSPLSLGDLDLALAAGQGKTKWSREALVPGGVPDRDFCVVPTCQKRWDNPYERGPHMRGHINRDEAMKLPDGSYKATK